MSFHLERMIVLLGTTKYLTLEISANYDKIVSKVYM